MSGPLTTLRVSCVATLALLVMALVPALTRGASPAERMTGGAFVVLTLGWLVVVALVNGGADDSGAVRFSPDGTLPPLAGPRCPSLEGVP